jgi:hypothetical protein
MRPSPDKNAADQSGLWRISLGEVKQRMRENAGLAYLIEQIGAPRYFRPETKIQVCKLSDVENKPLMVVEGWRE